MANPISKLNLVINGVTTQLDVHDANALTTEIDSSGTGWVRFKSGLQICYGEVVNNNNITTGKARYSYPMAFIVAPSVVVTPKIDAIYFVTVSAVRSTDWILCSILAYDGIRYTSDAITANYVAIGTWK